MIHMKFKKTLTTLFLVTIAFTMQAQSFKVENSLPVTNLTDSTNFSLLNARLGSRFSFSLLNEKQSIQTGSLGFDMDEQTGLLISLAYNNKTYCFRTTPLPRNTKYFNNQQLKFGPSSMELSGQTDEGIAVSFTLISSFTKSKASRISASVIPDGAAFIGLPLFHGVPAT